MKKYLPFLITAWIGSLIAFAFCSLFLPHYVVANIKMSITAFLLIFFGCGFLCEWKWK